MAKYIKKETALKVVEKYGLTNGVVWGRHTGLAICIASEIADIPAADVAPVVRCTDCKYHDDYGVHFCNRLGMDCPDDSDFSCSYGKPKNGDDSDAAD